MRELTPKEMDVVNGGISKCGWLGFLTLVSCTAGMLVACGIGGIGYAVLCDNT